MKELRHSLRLAARGKLRSREVCRFLLDPERHLAALAEKTRLHRTSDPVTFLGFVLRRKGDGVRVRLRHDNVVRMRQRMALVQGLYRAGALEIEEVRSHLMAWLAHAAHGQTKALVEAELRRLSFVRGEA